MINVLFIFILLIGSVLSCNPGESYFHLIIIYKEESSSQSIQIVDKEFGTTLYQFNGYGKDNTVDDHILCLQSREYSVITRDGLRDHWSVGSFFTIDAEGVFSVLYGSCDFGGYQEFSFYPSTPLPLFSGWHISDILVSDWYTKDFDDSLWPIHHRGDFPPYIQTRYYRTTATIDLSAISSSSSLLIGLHGRNVSSLYINGEAVFVNMNTTVYRDPMKRSDEFFMYSIPIGNIQSASMVIAIQSDGEYTSPIEDNFDIMITLIPVTSNRVLQAYYSSSHSMDYYRNPLAFAFDSSRGSYWRVRGREANVTILFTNRYPFIQFTNRHEFVNTLLLTNGNNLFTAPTTLRIDGCLNNQCHVVGIVESIEWHGVYETKTFYFNELAELFTQIIVFLSSEKDEIRVGEISLSASNHSFGLEYASSSLTFVHHTFFSIAPLYSVYTSFSITPSLPEGIRLLSNSGVIIGFAAPSALTQYTIDAVTLVSSQKVSTVLTIEIVGCSDTQQQLVKIDHSSRLWSNNERWTLSNSEGSEILSKTGFNCGTSEIIETHYLCLPSGNYVIHQENQTHEGPSLGSVSISLYQISLVDNAFEPLAILPFSHITSDFSFSTLFTPSLKEEWKLNTDAHIDRYWYHPRYQDESWPLITLDSLPVSNTIRLRKILSFNLLSIESIVVHLSSNCRTVLYVNGIYTFDRYSGMSKGYTLHLTSDSLSEGENLFALRLYCEVDNPKVLFRIQNLPASVHYLSYRSVKIESDSTEPSSSPHYVMDNNVLSDWIGLMDKNDVTLRFTFDTGMAQTVNSFCITNSLQENNADPHSWVFRGKFLDGNWYQIASYSNVYFQNRGEKRCFVVRSDYRNALLFAVRFDFYREDRQSMIAISEITLHSVAFNNKKIPAFAYGQSVVDVIRDIDFPQIVTPSIYYSNYWCYNLPEGLYLDKMNGRILGKMAIPQNDKIVTIFALTLDSRRVSTDLTLRLKECDNEFSFIEISFDAIDDVFNFLSFALYHNQHSNPFTRISVIPPSGASSTSYYFCIEKGSYMIQFTDKSNAGFLNAVYNLKVDGLLVQTGMFNSGFSSFHFTFSAGFFFPSHSLWYYSVDNTDPPSNWFASIDPIHEVWDVAYPGSFPSPHGCAQYFKTVIELSSTVFDLNQYVSFIIYFYVKGGAVLYVNKQEVLRHALPEGSIHRTTKPLSSFDEWTLLKTEIPIQFSFTAEEVIPIAVELHDFVTQPSSEFSLFITLQSDDSLCEMKPLISFNNVHSVEMPEAIYDYQYYNKVVFLDNNRNVEVKLDMQNREYHYITKFCIFSGNTAGEHPASISFQGGVHHPVMNETTWTELYSTKDVYFQRNHYGESKCFHFYNTRLFSLFRFVLSGFRQKTNMEIAEISFYGKRLDGYCEMVLNGTTTQTPNKQWKAISCPSLYSGYQYLFCENGNWTQSVNHCYPAKPQGFQYPQRMYICRQGGFVQIKPTVIGTELRFFIDYVPKGMVFDQDTGVLEGVYEEKEPTMLFTVKVVNRGGEQQASFGISVINNHEGLFILIAVLFVAILVGLIVYANQLIRNKDRTKKKAEQFHLNIKELPENLVSILV